MKRSTDRILTTHIGSLARPRDLMEMMDARLKGEPVDDAAYQKRVRDAVEESVKQQIESGIDIPTDGEQSKPGFNNYVANRLSGFERRPSSGRPPRLDSEEGRAFPEYYAEYVKRRAPIGPTGALVCTGPIQYTGQAEVQRDIGNLTAALDGLPHEEAFMPAIPAGFFVHPTGGTGNEHYKTQEEFLYALGDALREEYLAITRAGFILQIDDPSLTRLYHSKPGATLEERRNGAEAYIEALNHSLRGIPPEQIRYHTCYGIDEGPRTTDLPLTAYLDLMLKINAEAYSYEQANGQHDHEWHVWEEVKLPEGKILIPGVVSHSTNIVDHPELVAERLVRTAKLVGRENVIAAPDCGFATVASYDLAVHPTVVWAKFEAMADGARLASQRLWGRAAA
jgi:5-methyltetrahydropteroyltriglutamate--homocysteine methyltransferase